MAQGGALNGLKVVELAGLAPAPFAGMILADFGADVIRVDRPLGFNPDQLCRYKRSIALDLKDPNDIGVLKELVRKADVLIEPFRAGVMEKLGLGPGVLCHENSQLIYARMSGFQRKSLYEKMAGHDINYIAISGLLSLLGRKEQNPYPPGNFLGDFAGGGLMCALGILLALNYRHVHKRGQVVDTNMVDGSAYVASFARMALSNDMWNQPRGFNFLDGGAPFYNTYETSDGNFVAVGALEEPFYDALLNGLQLKPEDTPDRKDRKNWPALETIFATKFKTKTLEMWQEVFTDTDACVTPVINFRDVPSTDAAAVQLSESPSKPASMEGKLLTPGADSVGIIHDWLGWQDGKDYSFQNGRISKAMKASL